MNISAPFIKRRIATSLLMFAILLGGLLAYQFLPLSSLPEVEYPTMRVATFYPGASPDVMASAVTAPLERQFGQMPGLEQMISSSSYGTSIVTLQFTLDTSLDIAEQEVQASINAASNYLPTDLPYPPIYSKVNPADVPILTLSLTSDTLPLTTIEDFAETRLSQRLAQQSGVGLVTVSGGERPAVRVQVNPTVIGSYGLTLETIRTAINNANVNAAKGSFDGPRLAYNIDANDQLFTAADYRKLVVAYRNNAPVRLKDIANVIDGAEDAELAAFTNHTPAIILNIQRQPGANVIAVTDRIKALLPTLQNVLPHGIQLSILTDRTVTIRASLHEVKNALFLSVLLVVLVIFLFLRNVSATIIPSISVPLSLVGTLGVMYLLGFSLNNLTLMALTIAAGFVVDDAIVMIENITRYLEQGDSAFVAAMKGSGQIAFTIISLTLSLIAVLIPLLFMQDIVGRLFREFALTLSATILISAFVSLTLTPMLCAMLLKPTREDRTPHRFVHHAERTLDWIIEKYRVTLTWVFKHQGLILWLAFLTFLLTIFLFVIIPKGFFPIQDTGLIQAATAADQSVSFPEMVKQQQAAANVILKNPNIQNVSSFIGIDGTNLTLNSGRMLIALKPLEARDDSATDIIHDLQPSLARLPGISVFMQPVQDLSIDTQVSRTQYQYSLSSADPAQTALWMQRLLAKLQKNPILQDVTSDQQNNGLQTYLTIDRDSAARVGINMQLIDDTLYDAFGQRQVSTIFTQRNQYHVILEVQPEFQKDMTAFNNIYLTSTITNTDPTTGELTPTTGSGVPLSVFTTLNQGVAPLVVNRLDQFPTATLSFNLAPHASLGQAVQDINQAQQDLKMPESVQGSFEGAAKIFENALDNQMWLLLAAIFSVYIVLGILYESYIHPITILSTLPSAGVGALLALYLCNQDLSVIALIGIILLIGIVMKNAIMMIDFALEQERNYQKTPEEAIFTAAMLRFRPILMTTMAAMFGAVPLAIGTGMGAELRRPLGIAIIGGLLLSQLLTLYTTPVIYLAFAHAAKRVHAWLGHPFVLPKEE